MFFAEANLTLLVLYKLNGDRLNEHWVVRVLAKCIMQLPKPDFLLAKYLIDPKLYKVQCYTGLNNV